jgi:hypothetical protein
MNTKKFNSEREKTKWVKIYATGDVMPFTENNLPTGYGRGCYRISIA